MDVTTCDDQLNSDGADCGWGAGNDPCTANPPNRGLGTGLSPMFAIYLFASSGKEILDSRCKPEGSSVGESIVGPADDKD